MVIFLLLLILAVLLFGSSVVLGGLGVLLGFIGAVVALVYAKVTWGLTLDEVVRFGFLGLIGMIVAFVIVARISENFDKDLVALREEEKRTHKKNDSHTLKLEKYHEVLDIEIDGGPCPKCGNHLSEFTKFCSNCGVNFEAIVMEKAEALNTQDASVNEPKTKIPSITEQPAIVSGISVAKGQNNYNSPVKTFFYTLIILLVFSGLIISIIIMQYKSGYVPAWF